MAWYSFIPGLDTAIDSISGLGNALDGVTRIGTGDAGSNDSNLMQSQYDFTQRVFPPDLGESSYNGHYMVINICAQEESKYNKINGQTIFSPTGELSKVDALRYNIDTHYQIGGGSDGFTGSTASVGNSYTKPRFTRRIKESIALYMPNSELAFTDRAQYDDISLTGIISGAAGGIAKFVGSGLAGMIGSAFGVGNQAASAAGNLIDGAGQLVGNVSKIAGTPINPKVEVLFANTETRKFAFDFLFAPANEKESEIVQQIIRTLRFHAAPELRASSGLASFFFIPPSEFDITFFHRGVENRAIPRINTCVLEQVDVSYSPGGTYSTFYNGHPVVIRMMLHFREVEVPHKLRVLQGF